MPLMVGHQADEAHDRPYPAEMPLYHFVVHNGDRYDDNLDGGSELCDDAAARQEAVLVIRDLKKNNEQGWKGCTIEVMEGDRRVWQIPFD